MARVGALATGVCVLLLGAQAVCAQTVLHVDASAPPSRPATGYLQMGTGTAVDGHTFGINSRYLTLDGKPWLPVMGEFDYARVPESDWRRTLLKMKSSGVSVVSTYIYWNYHERRPGHFDWHSNLDLRHFVKLCRQVGLYVFLRIGPWDHAELRFGGLPDWVVRSMPTRRTDPVFMQRVAGFYEQIGKQVEGLLWKDGGPVIGIQLGNEYNLHGRGQGRQYIVALKKLARSAGLDVPLYAVTAWDAAVFPHHAVVPLFGGYPAKPWSTSRNKLPPSSVYAFRFKSRVSNGVLPTAHARTRIALDADAVARHTPFLGVEFAGGAPAMYRRRVVIAPDDIAAMIPVGLGSGVNMYGFYMFRGGRNRIFGSTMEESTRTGGYNDTPVVSYDYQAPIGRYGLEQPVLARIKPFLYFMRSFGRRLAPMVVYAPDKTPSSVRDLHTLRFAVRSLGRSGFLFVNNYVRQYSMVAHKNVQFALHLPGQTLRIPAMPTTIPAGAYFIWPFNFAMGGAHLRYATVQPVTCFGTKRGSVYVFMATPGVAPEFVFDDATRVVASSGRVTHMAGATRVDGLQPGLGAYIDVRGRSGQTVRVLLLTRAQADAAWIDTNGRQTRLFITSDQAFVDGGNFELRSLGDNQFHFSVFPAPRTSFKSSLPLVAEGMVGGFARFSASAPARHPLVTVTPMRKALPVPPVRIGGLADAPMQPLPEVYGDAAAWKLKVVSGAPGGLAHAYLRVTYQGDVARLFAGSHLLDDNYYNGQAWNIGLRHFARAGDMPLTLEVLPLRGDSSIYIQSPYRPKIPKSSQIARLVKVTIRPEYALSVAVGNE